MGVLDRRQVGVRVTDDLNETRWVGINRPVRLMDRLADMDPQRRAMVMQQMQLQPGDPRLQQVIGIENDISDLDVDITIEEGHRHPEPAGRGVPERSCAAGERAAWARSRAMC